MQRTLAAALIVVPWCAPVFAQLSINPAQDFIDKTTLLNGILSNRRIVGTSQKAQTLGQPAKAIRPTPAPVDVTAIRWTDGYLLPDRYAARLGVSGPSLQEAKIVLSSFLSLYQRTAARDGFPANDLAYGFAYFVVNSYMTLHELHQVPGDNRGKDRLDRVARILEKRAAAPQPSQKRAIYRQLKAALSRREEIQTMTDRQKQELTEGLAVLCGAHYTRYLRAVERGNDAQIEKARQEAGRSLEKILGVAADRVRITNAGLSL
jgi:hypothetical protein